MADRLTQLQDCLDQLATQMYASLRYIQMRHSYDAIESQPDMNPFSSMEPSHSSSHPHVDSANATQNSGGSGGPVQSSQAAHTQQSNVDLAIQNEQAGEQVDEAHASGHVPDPPDAFDAALHELAKDLVLKEQQIEALIDVLPGIGSSEQEQSQRMRELEAELHEVEVARQQAAAERERLLERLDTAIARVRRY